MQFAFLTEYLPLLFVKDRKFIFHLIKLKMKNICYRTGNKNSSNYSSIRINENCQRLNKILKKAKQKLKKSGF